MNGLKCMLLPLALTMVSLPVYAASGSFELESAHIDASDQESLQRGAQTFVNYCMGCHTADYHRYSRLAADLGLSEEEVVNNLIFTTDEAGERDKVGSLMGITMTESYARQSFGVIPPNLALTARSRGVDWIYTYLKSFYLDPERTNIGVNNLVYKGAAMPHVLWEQQGWREPVYEEHDGNQVFKSWKTVSDGTMSADQYDGMVSDLVNFLAYLADPIKQTRHRIGLFVMLFLFILFAITYLLKKEYWKDVVK